jgi:hypothetical protein
MNECLKLGSGEERANVRLWVVPGMSLRNQGLVRLIVTERLTGEAMLGSIP